MVKGGWLRFALVLFCFSMVGIGEAHAKKNILNVLFPYIFPYDPELKDGGNDIEEKLEAPFSVDNGAAKGALGELYDPIGSASAGSPLAKPHRHHKQVADWVLKAVADSLTVDPAKYENHIENLSSTYNRHALQEYQKFMVGSQTLAALRANGHMLQTFVEPPLLLNQAVLEGRYRWLYEIPATLSFVPKGLESYEGVNPITHRVLVRVQVGRIQPQDEQHDIIIETFDVSSNTDE